MREETWLTESIFTVDEFFDPSECQKYIQIAEDIGFEDALVNTSSGTQRVSRLRNNERVMFVDHDTAELIWSRASDFVPPEFEGRTAVGVNEMLRFYRYDPGQQFDWHQDFGFERENGEASFFTLLIYLNADFDGGETSFDDSCSEDTFDEFSLVPVPGLALFFEHPTHHKGQPVSAGRKYVLRTDIMYSPEADSDQDDQDLDQWD